MSADYTTAAIGFFFALVFFGAAFHFHGPVDTYQYEEYELKINPNPIDAEDVPANATVVNYRTISESERDVANDVIGGEDADLGYTGLHTYTYRLPAADKPAATFANADYLRYDNAYYQIFASTDTDTRDDIGDAAANGIALFAGLFGLFFAIGGLGAALGVE